MSPSHSFVKQTLKIAFSISILFYFHKFYFCSVSHILKFVDSPAVMKQLPLFTVSLYIGRSRLSFNFFGDYVIAYLYAIQSFQQRCIFSIRQHIASACLFYIILAAICD